MSDRDDTINYMVWSYSLIINNDQYSYSTVTNIVREIFRESDITPKAYAAMSTTERHGAFVDDIGTRILDQVREWCEEVTDAAPGIGSQIIEQVMMYSDSSLAWRLGVDFLPDDAEALEYLAVNEEIDTDDENEV